MLMKHINSRANQAYDADTCKWCYTNTQSQLYYGKTGCYITLSPKCSFNAGNQTLSTKFFIWPLTMQMGHFQLKLITPCLLKAMAFKSSAH